MLWLSGALFLQIFFFVRSFVFSIHLFRLFSMRATCFLFFYPQFFWFCLNISVGIMVQSVQTMCWIYIINFFKLSEITLFLPSSIFFSITFSNLKHCFIFTFNFPLLTAFFFSRIFFTNINKKKLGPFFLLLRQSTFAFVVSYIISRVFCWFAFLAVGSIFFLFSQKGRLTNENVYI